MMYYAAIDGDFLFDFSINSQIREICKIEILIYITYTVRNGECVQI